MTKQELEEKIKNNESVWIISLKYLTFLDIEEICLNKNYFISEEISPVLMKQNGYEDEYIREIEDIFNTKAQAQHYLDCSNVTRTEKLPYMTWEEAKKYSDQEFYIIEFYNKNYLSCCIEVNFSFKYISVFEGDFLFKNSRYDLTEENFYKAYKVAKDLFLGGKNE